MMVQGVCVRALVFVYLCLVLEFGNGSKIQTLFVRVCEPTRCVRRCRI